ncbi:hypothetical protein [Agrobacterium cavarae]|uniref:hypothetical protein n=1 Tax=Agrobacterium cavarae TaxID=2528239 RepID=UPI0028AE886E|nr:hypothetical protein [Agrobacterium cavarae]
MQEELKTFEEMTGAERHSLVASVVDALEEAAEKMAELGDRRNAENSLCLAGSLMGLCSSSDNGCHDSAELLVEQGIRFVCLLDDNGRDHRQLQ